MAYVKVGSKVTSCRSEREGLDMMCRNCLNYRESCVGKRQFGKSSVINTLTTVWLHGSFIKVNSATSLLPNCPTSYTVIHSKLSLIVLTNISCVCSSTNCQCFIPPCYRCTYCMLQCIICTIDSSVPRIANYPYKVTMQLNM